MGRFAKRVLGILLKFSVLFILVEVIWMLLPFAGFLYGSAFHMKYLNKDPHTAWLAHFVFPVHTMFPLGIIFMSLGFIMFLLGAGQIYTAKFRKTGLVTCGLYRRSRHPQYIALVLFGVGALLTWGRFITFIAFFVMMFLYYRLACSEERNCEKLFGKAYETYRARTYFLLPGEAWIANAWKRLPSLGWPNWLLVPLHLALVIGLALVLGVFIQSAKVRYQNVPFIITQIAAPLQTGVEEPLIPFIESEDSRLILVQGPLGLAQKKDYAHRLIKMIAHSTGLQERLGYLEGPTEDRAVVLVGYPDGPPQEPPDEDSIVELFIVRVRPSGPGVNVPELLANPGKRNFISAVTATLDPNTPQGRDPAIGITDHPEAGIYSRWTNMTERIRKRVTGIGESPGAGPKKLILVQAPLVRARDAAFAQQIMDRLLRSETVKGILARYQIGGNLLAVAFPRPGPNWYREHHGVPQIGVYVMLVRKTEPIPDSELFHYDMKRARALEAAFIVEMDFAIPPPKDPVYQAPFTVGPLRNLEERWDFFLSGVK